MKLDFAESDVCNKVC